MIDTSGINVNFPAAGQNNSSQGFRDNFNAIKTSLDIAGQVLSGVDFLAKSAVVKDSTAGTTALNNDFNYHHLTRPLLKSHAVLYADIGFGGNYLNIDFYRASIQRFRVNSDIRLNFANFPENTIVGSVKVWIENSGGPHVLFLPDTVGFSPTSAFFANRTITMPYDGDYLFEFIRIGEENRIWCIDHSNRTAGAATQDRLGLVKIDGNTLSIDNDGKLSVRSGTPSDLGLKHNIRPIDRPVDLVQRLRGVRFNWNHTEQEDIGMIAQELEGVLPELVYTDSDGYKRIYYDRLSALLVEVVKELSIRLENLEQRTG
jgi:hypothetical protein